MYAILIKDSYVVILKDKSLKLTRMTTAQFDEEDEFTQTTLLLTLENKILFNVQAINTTTNMLWESLQKVYEDKSLMNKIFLRRKLYKLRINNATSIHEHLNEFNSLASEFVRTLNSFSHLIFTEVKSYL